MGQIHTSYSPYSPVAYKAFFSGTEVFILKHWGRGVRLGDFQGAQVNLSVFL